MRCPRARRSHATDLYDAQGLFPGVSFTTRCASSASTTPLCAPPSKAQPRRLASRARFSPYPAGKSRGRIETRRCAPPQRSITCPPVSRIGNDPPPIWLMGDFQFANTRGRASRGSSLGITCRKHARGMVSDSRRLLGRARPASGSCSSCQLSRPSYAARTLASLGPMIVRLITAPKVWWSDGKLDLPE